MSKKGAKRSGRGQAGRGATHLTVCAVWGRPEPCRAVVRGGAVREVVEGEECVRRGMRPRGWQRAGRVERSSAVLWIKRLGRRGCGGLEELTGAKSTWNRLGSVRCAVGVGGSSDWNWQRAQSGRREAGRANERATASWEGAARRRAAECRCVTAAGESERTVAAHSDAKDRGGRSSGGGERGMER
jgi:hypothetical protein